MLIKIAFIIGLVILALGVVIAFFHGLRLLDDGGIYIILAIPVVAPLILLFLWLWRMTALATTEFVRVIMDIEQNTRNI